MQRQKAERLFHPLRLLRRTGRSKSGAAAVEFALVVPVLFAFFFGMIEYGFVYFTYGTMQAAARDVVRQMAVNTIDADDGEAEVRSRLPDWAFGDAAITVTQTDATNPITNIYQIDVEVPVSSATPMAFFSRAQSSNVHTRVQMKQELPFRDFESESNASEPSDAPPGTPIPPGPGLCPSCA